MGKTKGAHDIILRQRNMMIKGCLLKKYFTVAQLLKNKTHDHRDILLQITSTEPLGYIKIISPATYRPSYSFL